MCSTRSVAQAVGDAVGSVLTEGAEVDALGPVAVPTCGPGRIIEAGDALEIAEQTAAWREVRAAITTSLTAHRPSG